MVNIRVVVVLLDRVFRPNYGIPTSTCTSCETPIQRTQFYCSVVGHQVAFVNVFNNTDCNIDFWWDSYNQLPYSCQPVYYITVTANNSFQIQSYVTHPFKFYLNNSNQLIYELPPLTGNTTVTFNCGSTTVVTTPIIFSVYPPALNVGETLIIMELDLQQRQL